MGWTNILFPYMISSINWRNAVTEIEKSDDSEMKWFMFE